jgi:hypothetical protein
MSGANSCSAVRIEYGAGIKAVATPVRKKLLPVAPPDPDGRTWLANYKYP